VKQYKAPFSKLLIVVSAAATLVCLGIAFGTPFLPSPKNWGWIQSNLHWLPLLLMACCIPFMVLGYIVTPDAILVRRPFWVTRLPRAGLQSATADPAATQGSIRTCGNGGLFSFTGLYWSKKLGPYRAYVTDRQRTVVLRYSGRTVVVSPDEPEDFVRALETTP